MSRKKSLNRYDKNYRGHTSPSDFPWSEFIIHVLYFFCTLLIPGLVCLSCFMVNNILEGVITFFIFMHALTHADDELKANSILKSLGYLFLVLLIVYLTN